MGKEKGEVAIILETHIRRELSEEVNTTRAALRKFDDSSSFPKRKALAFACKLRFICPSEE